MKNPFYIVFLGLMLCNNAFPQNDSTKTANNVMYIEVAGAGGYGSVNYERVIKSSKLFMLGIRLGMGTYHINDYTTHFNPDLLFPVSVNGSYGKNHKIELDFGQVFASTVIAGESTFEPTRESDFHSFLSIGYRYQKKNGGLLFRCNYTPIFEFNSYFRQWLGISIGFSF
jgi:hypothetical protein